MVRIMPLLCPPASDEEQKPRALLVDDNLCLLSAGKISWLETALSGKEAMERLRHAPYDVVVSDYDMPLMDDSEFKRRLRSEGIQIPFIFFTAKSQENIISDEMSDPGACVSKYGDPSVQRSGGSCRNIIS